MGKLRKDQTGFGAFEAILIVGVIAIIGVAGFMVYSSHKSKTTPVASTTNTKTSTPNQKYITISAWGVRVPYSGNDTLTVAKQTCTENGDASGDVINLGCQVPIVSKELANAVGSCQSTKATGTVGYFYRLGTNDNYQETSGAGFGPVAQWAAANPGQYTQIGSYHYAYAPIGAAWGGQGAESINTSTHGLADTVPAGCGKWVTEYNAVEPPIKALAAKFEAIQ